MSVNAQKKCQALESIQLIQQILGPSHTVEDALQVLRGANDGSSPARAADRSTRVS